MNASVSENCTIEYTCIVCKHGLTGLPLKSRADEHDSEIECNTGILNSQTARLANTSRLHMEYNCTPGISKTF